MSGLDNICSLLFVPGDRPERFAKAIAAGPGAVILDLEDSVGAADKAAARDHIAAFLDEVTDAQILLRINAADTDDYHLDLALAQHSNLAGVVLPKAEADSTKATATTLSCPLWPIIESMRGLSELPITVQVPGVARLLYGTLDLALELGLDSSHEGGQSMLNQGRFLLLSQSLIAGLPAPLDGVCPVLNDDGYLRRTAQYSCAAGMGGMLCIHPNQIAIVESIFTPSDTQIEWASAVVKAAVGRNSSFQFRGQMVDEPVLKLAQKILIRAKAKC
jgi:citrate lyase beta subunit